MSILDFFKKEKESEKATQTYLDIERIKDSTVVLRSGGLRAVLQVSAVNFDLKSEKEQDAIIARYQGFLNSLNFPIQILIHSRRIDLSPYLENLKKRFEAETNDLLKTQMADYIGFLHELIGQANIMDKKYFVVVPYEPISLKPASLFSLPGKKESPEKLSDSAFNAHKEELSKRMQVAISGLSSIGLKVIRLNSQQLIELFYNIYNPEIATEEHLKRIEELVAPIVKEAKIKKAA